MSSTERTYAVIDLETSGLSPKSGRIVELAVILLSSRGEMLDRYDTLINPEGPVGAVHIHGITQEMITEAPRFGEILGDIIPFFQDSVLVAHNAPFDKGFLLAECRRSGVRIRDLPSVCTLRMSRKHYAHRPSRSLGAMCSFFGISLEGAHTAMEDCAAAAQLFGVLAGTVNPETFLTGVRDVSWPDIPPSGLRVSRSGKL